MSAKVSAQKAAGRYGLREKTKLPAARQSTPDSEALASSDDDVDRIGHMPASARPVRRSSWLNDIRPTRISGPGSGQGSLPTTPSAEADSWLPQHPQHNNIWQSQSSISSSRALDESPLASPTSYGDTSLPFEFPLQPTRKTFRSASYSVGQLGDESEAPDNHQVSSSSALPQSYRAAPAGLYHRPSRPSQLNASWGLSRLREDDDGLEEDDVTDITTPRNGLGLPPETSSSRLLKQAATEHARIRQRTFTAPQIPSPDPSSSDAAAAAEREREADTARPDPGAHTSSSAHPAWNGSLPSPLLNSSSNPYSLHTSDDLYAEGPSRRAQWQSQLGFGHVGEGPQSRRHSFADVPLRTRDRTGSLRDIYGNALEEEEFSELYPTNNHRSDKDDGQHPDMYSNKSNMRSEYQFYQQYSPTEEDALQVKNLYNRLFAAHYFSPSAMQPGMGPGPGPSSMYSLPPPTTMNPYTVPQSFTRTPRHIYVVSFKCARAEIYYIPGSTGLNVNVLDMVIVDGDRGWDLGTVTAADVSIEEARRMRERAAEEHYHWLMLFSRHNPQNGQIGGPSSSGIQGNPALSLPRPPLSGKRVPGPEQPHGEHGDKVRMIKRLAIPHEVNALRDKEGSEAKAKRICQAKVAEHGLAMEILDAEYQADWKKLTFFFYAEHYVNFNDLVSDLFKIFKTRIWMASINPAAAPEPAFPASHGPPQGFTPRPRARNGTGPAWPQMNTYNSGYAPTITTMPSHSSPMNRWAPPGLYDAPGPVYNVPIGRPDFANTPNTAPPGHVQTPEAFEMGLQALSLQSGGRPGQD